MNCVAKLMTVLALTMLVSASAIAQNPEDPGTDPDASVPLDGGLFTVLLSGAGIGVYKLIKNKKERV